MSSYVAFTRVKRMEDLLIFRPFLRDLFNQGNLEGPALLLKVLRGEEIDWQAVEEKHMPSHMCAGCDTKQFKAEFSEPQWKRSKECRYCKTCEGILSCRGTRKQCTGSCEQWLTEESFAADMWKTRQLDKLICMNCGQKRRCRGECGEWKFQHEFSASEWRRAALNTPRGKCLQCAKRHGNPLLLKVCNGKCGQELPEMCFTKNILQRVTTCNKSQGLR